MRRHRLLVLAALAALPLAATGCSASGGPTSSTSGTLRVLASFYPLQYVVEQVGGNAVHVSSLTPAGAEPHDLELSPKEVRSVGSADLVVYLGGFQAAVDDAVKAAAPPHVLDVAPVADLVPAATEGSAGDSSAGASGTFDPHFWLDPVRLAAVADAVGTELSSIDPAHATDYRTRASALVSRLTALDHGFSAGLASCDRREIVTSHDAFGYLAARYRLVQVGIAGLEPDAQPSGARLKQVAGIVRQKGVTTIFFETLVSPKVAETLASDLGVTSAVLDPIEGLTDPSTDYRGVMLANLAALRTALGCP